MKKLRIYITVKTQVVQAKKVGYIVLGLLFSFVVQTTEASTILTVAHQTGVSLRTLPDQNSKRLAVLMPGTEILLLEKTTETIELIHPFSNKKTIGTWLKVETATKLTGYVVDLYVMATEASRYSYCDKAGEDYTCHSTIDTQLFTATIYNYQTQTNNWSTGDTIHTYEWVFNYIGGKTMQVVTHESVKNAQVFFAINEHIDQQFNDRVQESPNDWKTWRKTAAQWRGQSSYQPLNRKGNFFVIPTYNIAAQEQMRKEKMALKDTLVDLSGESWNVATLIYKGEACRYTVPSGLLKFVLTMKDGRTETRYIEIIFSYGC